MSKPPVHPGLILEQEWLGKIGVTQYRVAKETFVPPRRINEIVKGLRGITPDTALRFARYFGNKPEYWINLQIAYDMAKERDRLKDTLAEITPREARTPPGTAQADSESKSTPNPAQSNVNHITKDSQSTEKSENLSRVEELLGVDCALEQPHQTDFFS